MASSSVMSCFASFSMMECMYKNFGRVSMKVMKRKMRQVLALLLIIAMVATTTQISPVQVQAATKQDLISTYEGEGYTVTLKVTNQWSGGFNADVTISNISDKIIDNWSLGFALPYEITNIWNGVINSNENGIYVIKNTGSNQDIAISKSVSFGFSAKADGEVVLPNTYAMLSYEKMIDEGFYEVNFKVTSDWKSEFNGEIQIKNISSHIIEDWKLDFDFDNNIEKFWTAEIIHRNDNHYTIKNSGYNSNINPGESIILGFSANPGNVSSIVKNAKLFEVTTSPYIIDYTKDSDSDGLYDYIEYRQGTDINKVDTDGDSLSDWYECLVSFTNPLKVDTDNDGISDSNEDIDNDGLTNYEEFVLKTYPLREDSDGDGLKDGDEVNIYETNPLVADFDNDGLNDGDEIMFGTNPKVSDTNGNGIKDGDEKFQQSITHKVENEDSVIKEVTVSFKGTGNINNTTKIESVMDKDIISSNVVGLVGEPFEFQTSSNFDEAVISFGIDKEKLGDTSFDNLLYLWYDEENYRYVELETIYDYDNSTVSVKTTHFSRYMIVDKQLWFKAWEEKFNYNPSENYPGAPTISYNTVLTIDCSGSMSSYDEIKNRPVNSPEDAKFAKTCQRILACEGFIAGMNPTDKAAVVLFDGSASVAENMTGDKYKLNLALQNIRNSGGTNFNNAIAKSVSLFSLNDFGVHKNNRIILLSDGEDNASNNILDTAKEKNIKIYTIGLGQASYDAELKRISNYTGGEFYKAMTSTELIDIYKDLGIDMSDFDKTDTDRDGLYDAVEAAGIRLQNGRIIYTDPSLEDTDSDGLKDSEEIDPKIRWEQKYNVPSSVPVTYIPKQYYFAMKSHPQEKDSDKDEYSDYDEVKKHKTNPLVSDVKKVQLSHPYTKIDTSSVSKLDNDYFGGYQGWFYDEKDGTKNDIKSKQISGGGCGVIASCDSILYIQKYKSKALTPVNTSKQMIAWREYDSFVRSYASNYLTPFDVESAVIDGVTPENTKVKRPLFMTSLEKEWYDLLDELNYISSKEAAKLISDLITDGTGTWGCNPYSMTTGFNKFIADKGFNDINLTYYNSLYDRKKLEEMICKSLSNDVPAIMMIGLQGDVAYMYDGETTMSRKMTAHFVTITGISIDKITGKTTLTISTWSEKAYIELGNFIDNAGILGGIAIQK